MKNVWKPTTNLHQIQRDILYYIRTINPDNEGINISGKEIAYQISGIEWIVDREIRILITKGYLLESFSSKFALDNEAEWRVGD